MASPTFLARLQIWLQARLGKRYAVVVETTDRAITAFGVAFAAKTILAEGFDVHQALQLSWWETAALAGLAAAVSVVKSALLAIITGTPALLALISRTLRARRELPIVRHYVPLRPRKTRAPAA